MACVIFGFPCQYFRILSLLLQLIYTRAFYLEHENLKK